MNKSIILLLSARYLAKRLKGINFPFDRVERINLEGDTVTLITQEKTISFQAFVLKFSASCSQINASWGNLRDVIKNLPDQPVMLDISEDKVKLIFEF